jgi:tryptophanyl-tRNA synthetase
MSKSLGNFIALSDEPKDIEKKIAGMITDPERIHLADKGHPGICGVYSYYSVFGDEALKKDVKGYCEGARVGCTECKKRLAKLITETLAPIREKRKTLTDAALKEILRDGAKRARQAASETMAEVKRLINLV